MQKKKKDEWGGPGKTNTQGMMRTVESQSPLQMGQIVAMNNKAQDC